MSNEEAIKLIIEHMAIHRMNEPRAIKISMALQKAIYSLEKNEEQIRAEERTKAIDEYTEVLRPLISELRNTIEKNRYAFIDLDLIADKLKEQENGRERKEQKDKGFALS